MTNARGSRCLKIFLRECVPATIENLVARPSISESIAADDPNVLDGVLHRMIRAASLGTIASQFIHGWCCNQVGGSDGIEVDRLDSASMFRGLRSTSSWRKEGAERGDAELGGERPCFRGVSGSIWSRPAEAARLEVCSGLAESNSSAECALLGCCPMLRVRGLRDDSLLDFWRVWLLGPSDVSQIQRATSKSMG